MRVVLSGCGREPQELGTLGDRLRTLPDIIGGVKGGGFTTNAVLLHITGGLFSSGGVTSKPIVSFKAIFTGFEKFVEKCESPISSKLLFLLPFPILGSPCRREFDLLRRMSSITLRLLDRPR